MIISQTFDLLKKPLNDLIYLDLDRVDVQKWMYKERYEFFSSPQLWVKYQCRLGSLVVIGKQSRRKKQKNSEFKTDTDINKILESTMTHGSGRPTTVSLFYYLFIIIYYKKDLQKNAKLKKTIKLEK